MEDKLRDWLRSFGLQEYEERFKQDGWEKLDDIFHIDEDDLNACIHKAGHRKIFHRAVQETKAPGVHPSVKLQYTNKEELIPYATDNTKDENVEIWLHSIGLGHYISNFQEEGWDRLEVLNDMDEQDICNCIGKPGHRKKFQIALKNKQLFELSATTMPDVLQQKEDVKSWLTKHDLELYFDRLDEEGWDTLEVLFKLCENERDLKKCFCKPGHRKHFQLAVNNEKSLEIQGAFPHGQLHKAMGDVQMRRENRKEDIASDFTTVNDDLMPPRTERSENNNDSFLKKEDELTQRHTDNQIDKSAPAQTTFSESPVRFGLSFEENETQSMTDSCDDQQLDSVETIYTTEARNMDSSGGSTEESETRDPYDIGRMDPEKKKKTLQRTYSLPPIPSSMFIHKAKNVSIGGKIVDVSSKTFSPDAKRKYRDNFKKQMKTALEVAKEKDSFFVETSAYLELEKKVHTDHWGVIIGIPGDGKTSMAGHLSLKYNAKGYDYLELHFARDWKDWVYNGKKQFILIDDIFGRMSIDERKVSEWSSIIELMQKVVQQRQGCLKVVCTSRKYVFEDVKTKLAQYACFQKPSLIDMTQSGLTLTKKEKLQIWNAYEKKFDMQIPHPFLDETKEDIDSNQVPHGFPHCVDLYFSSPSLQNERDFFDNPMQCICRELYNFKDHDKFKYCAMLLVLLNDNKLEEVFIEKMTVSEPGFRPIVLAAGLHTVPTSNDLKQALKGLRSTYITEIDGCYSISHDSIRESLAFVFIEQNPGFAINNMEFEYLTEHTRCPGQTSSDHPHSRLMFTLKSQYSDDLVTRMLQEIKRGNVVTVCLHQAWDDKAFVEHIIQYLLKKSEESGIDQHGYSSIDYVFNTKDSPTAYIFDYNLFDGLGCFGHKEAVQQMTQSKLKTIIDHIPGSMETPKEIIFEKPLSLRLDRIMNKIGASQDLRDFQIHSAISMEVLDTVCVYIAKEKFRCYIFGSHSEGTRIITHIPKRDCDVNYLFCLKDTEVVQSMSEIRSDQNVQYLLAVTDDKITRPGYVKLQIVNNGVPQTKSTGGDKIADTKVDHQDRVVLYQRRPDKIHVDENKGLNVTTDIVTGKVRENMETQTTTEKIVTGTDYELHYSFRCRSWPVIATKWISRIRHHNWPSRSVIEQIKSLGVFLVPVGSQGSIEKDLEWKILFLLQERMLMSILNDTQYKCYIVLKMINNDIISNHFEEPILVSYHLKTCLFYVIENTQDTLWRPERLLDCVQICLKHILQCVNKGNCPNYFIPQENMFYRRVGGEVQTQLKNVLIDLLACKVCFWYLPTITCGNLGPRLVQAIYGKTDTLQSDQDLVPSPVRLYLKLIKFLSLVKMRILCKCFSTDVGECIQLHFKEAVKPLHESDSIIDHSKEQTERAFSLVLPYVELSLMSVLVARQMEMSNDNDDDDKILPLLVSKKWRQIGLSIPAGLKQATFLHMHGQINASLRVVRSIVQSMNSQMISVCGCQYYHTEVDEATTERIKDMSEPEFRKNMCVSCVAFLPTEEKIIPSVLGYEMRRAKAKPDSNCTFHFWYNWAVVDGKVLMYLILYLNYRAISRGSHTMLLAEVSTDIRRKTDNVIKELHDTINSDPNLGHKETGLNILGWIYRQEGLEDEAERCFRESLGIQSAYNAANLHMEELVYYG